jgi:ABC-type sugar transport system permease subunit
MEWAIPSVVLVSIWKFLGFYTVIFVAGLKNIPEELTSAALADGARPWQIFWRITLPIMRPVTFFVVTIAIIASFQAFDQVYIMTRGGPYYATYLTMFYIYDTGFRTFNFGYASALSTVFFILLFIFTFLQLRYTQPEPLS